MSIPPNLPKQHDQMPQQPMRPHPRPMRRHQLLQLPLHRRYLRRIFDRMLHSNLLPPRPIPMPVSQPMCQLPLRLHPLTHHMPRPTPFPMPYRRVQTKGSRLPNNGLVPSWILEVRG